MQSTPLDNSSYPLFVVMNYRPRKILNLNSFNKDVKLFKNVKSNINRIHNKNNIDMNLIINQITILQNQFNSLAVSRILFYLTPKEQHSILATILSFLSLFDVDRILEVNNNIKLDKNTTELLKTIYRRSLK